LPDDGAEGRIARHFGIAPAPGHAALRIEPHQPLRSLGDARSNNLDPRADILRRIAERSKRLVWLNPEGRMAWGWGDSEMPRYSTFCTVVRQCATAKQLERAVSDIVASYQ
jgi:hypothetical protein